MKRIVIITGPGFQDEEFIYPYYRFLEEGFDVDVVVHGGGVVYGKYGTLARGTFRAEDLKERSFDAVYLPGGHEAPDRVRQDKSVLKFVFAMDGKKKTVAAICHGPWIMISALVTTGRTMTGYVGIKDDIRNSGADYLTDRVVVDRNFVTAQHYRDMPEFMRATIKNIKGE